MTAARAAHEQYVARAADALADMGAPAVLEAWARPAEGERLLALSRERALDSDDLVEADVR